MNKPLTGGNWGNSLPCHRCRRQMHGLVVCPNCGAKQPEYPVVKDYLTAQSSSQSDHLRDGTKKIEPPKLRRPGVFSD